MEADMEELTLSQVAAEFHINRNSLNVWVWSGKIPARKDITELGVPYYLVKRGDVSQFLYNRRKFGRPIKRTP
jgi:hypothetical protein